MDIDRLIADITSDSENKRISAVEKLAQIPPESVLPKLGEVILEVGTPEVVGACFDVMEKFESSVSMAEVRMDGWFDQISKHITHLEEITAVLGARFLAYSFVLNIQIRSLMLDPMTPANTAIHFTLNDETMQTLSLGEFKLRVVQALLRDDRLPIAPSLPLTTETAIAVLGGRNVLVAPLFGITIERVMVVGLPPTLPKYLVAFLTPDGFNIADLDSFHELIRDHLRSDLLGTEEQLFSLDLYAVERARKAASEGENEKVVEILEAWPGLLSVLQRAPIKKHLDEEQLRLIGEGVSLLGEALERTNQLQWSEELYKLGLQFVREGEMGGRLFANLGRLLVRKAAFGEAIGHLRRALSLGVSPEMVVPYLGRAFLKRDKVTAAAALLKFSEANGYVSDDMAADLAEIEGTLGDAGVVWDVPVPEPAEVFS